MSLPENTQELLDNFSILDDWQDRYRYIIELGNELSPLDDAFKVDAYKVLGCQSQVWLRCLPPEDDDSRLVFHGDSDAHIVRGLIAVLFTIFSNRTPSEILETDITAIFEQLDMDQHLSPGRSNGLASMIKKMQQYAREAG